MKEPTESFASESLGQTVLRATVETEPLKELGLDVAEIALDKIFDEGLLRDVPVIGSLIALVKATQNIRDRVFLKKILLFVSPLSNLTQRERNEFARENLSDKKKAKKLGEALVLILDKFDDFEKSALLAKMYAALMRQKIELGTFKRLAAAIDIGFVDDLKMLAEKPFEHLYSTHYLLVPTGLVATSGDANVEPDQWGNLTATEIYKLTPLGNMFVGCMNENYGFTTAQ